MLLRTIALDYDGTIATNGVLHSKVREAIREVRNAGLLVIIVTGKILRELRLVAGDLSFVDGVVAENGAVILVANSHRRILAPPPFPVLLNELSNRGIEFVVGRCLVDLDAEHAHTVLSILKELELPLTLSFNRSRIMVMPQSISKSSGLREILNIFGTSVHNALGIGDAENDYELLQCCEYGVAVGWAHRFLKDKDVWPIHGQVDAG
jgi:hydroxymethylpyrimidine pyrophosphatase-like HAD family hydrolase